MKGFFAKMMLGTMLTTVCLTGSALAATTETPAQNQENQTAMVEQQTEAAPVRVYGNVVEKGENRLFIQNDQDTEANQGVVIHISEDTLILDATTGMPKSLEDIADNEMIYAYVGPAMTMSLPPQSTAELILCDIPADFAVPTYAEVESVQKNQDGSITVSTNQDVNMTITEDTNLFPYLTKNIVTMDSLQPGTKILAWYSIVMPSQPAQANPTQVMVFPYEYQGYVSVQENAIQVNGVAVDGKPVLQNGRWMVPMRPIVEALGAEIIWNAQTAETAVVSQHITLYQIKVGEDTYTKDGDIGYLCQPAKTINGTTYLDLTDLARLQNIKIAE